MKITEKNTKTLAKRGLYVGSGIGLILFVLLGMFPGSLIGGAIGLQICSALFGVADPTLIMRGITAICMLAGALGAAMFFIISTSVAGWAVGASADLIKLSKEAGEIKEVSTATLK